MLDDCNIRIKRLQNGYTVSITDPKIVKANDSSKGSWKNPDVTYTFADPKEVVKFITENIEKAFPESEFDSTFDKAAKELK